MNISKIQNPAVTGTSGDKSASTRAKGADEGSKRLETGNDTVSVSSAATEMGKLEQRVSASDGIDREKIEAVKEALKHGDYPFNPEKIADKMIGMERLLS